MWHKGSVQEAVTLTKSAQYMLLVFVVNEDDAASDEISVLLDDKSVVDYCQTLPILAIKLLAKSKGGMQFAQIYPVHTVPIIYLIGIDGKPLDFIVHSPTICASEIVERFRKAYEKHFAMIGAPPGGISSSNDTMINACPPPNISTKEEPAENERKPLEERVARAKQLLKKKQDEQDKLYEDEINEAERRRREEGKAIQEQQAKRHEEELIRASEERRKQKIDDKAHLQRIRDQMKADRAEKQAAFHSRKDEEERIHQQKLQKQREQQEIQAATNSNQARLLFRFAGSNKTATNTFDSDNLLTDVIAWIDEHHPCGNFSMSQTYPKQDFTGEHMNISLRDLLLPPSATIIIKPVGVKMAGPSSSAATEWSFNKIWAMIMAVLWIPIGFIMSVIARFSQPAIKSESKKHDEPPQGKSKLIREHNESLEMATSSNIRRLHRNNADDDDENATWNGNSTQQL